MNKRKACEIDAMVPAQKRPKFYHPLFTADYVHVILPFCRIAEALNFCCTCKTLYQMISAWDMAPSKLSHIIRSIPSCEKLRSHLALGVCNAIVSPIVVTNLVMYSRFDVFSSCQYDFVDSIEVPNCWYA